MIKIAVLGRPGCHLYIGAATAESTADQPIKQTFRLLNIGWLNETTGNGVSGAIGIGTGGESHPVIEAAKEGAVETSVSPEPTPEPQPEPTPEPTSEPVGAEAEESITDDVSEDELTVAKQKVARLQDEVSARDNQIQSLERLAQADDDDCPEPVSVTAEEPYDDWEALHKAEFENEVYT